MSLQLRSDMRPPQHLYEAIVHAPHADVGQEPLQQIENAGRQREGNDHTHNDTGHAGQREIRLRVHATDDGAAACARLIEVPQPGAEISVTRIPNLSPTATKVPRAMSFPCRRTS